MVLDSRIPRITHILYGGLDEHDYQFSSPTFKIKLFQFNLVLDYNIEETPMVSIKERLFV
jgi:hypothetical protein